MKIMIACGGTGGHLFPGLAVAEALTTRRHAVRLVVSQKAVDHTALAAANNSIDVKTVSAIGYAGPRRLLPFGLHLAQATRECIGFCREFEPDIVLAMGGFTAPPAIWAARWSRRQAATVIHESNAVPGKANRWVGRSVDHIALGFGDCAQFFNGHPKTITGTPIRAALRTEKMPNAKEQLGLKHDRMTVLVTGGSQGAHAINEAVVCALPWLDEQSGELQFIHISGEADETFVRESYAKNGFTARVFGFCSRMELAYSAADLVIARAGAATLTEIAAFGLPSLLVPYPHAADDHQRHNAAVFARAGASRVIEQSQLSQLHATMGERMSEIISNLLRDESARAQMAIAARTLHIGDAAGRIATLLEQCAVKRTPTLYRREEMFPAAEEDYAAHWPVPHRGRPLPAAARAPSPQRN